MCCVLELPVPAAQKLQQLCLFHLGMFIFNMGGIFPNEVGGLWGSFMHPFLSQMLSIIFGA